MRFFVIRFIATLFLIYSTGAQANTDIGVGGTILEPACTLSLSNGGKFEYAVIAASQLNIDEPTYIGERAINFTIYCDSRKRVALRALDNRKEEVAPGVIAKMPHAPGHFDDKWAFGLGTAAGGRVGSYVLRFNQEKTNGDLQHVNFRLGAANNPARTSWGSSTRHAIDGLGQWALSFAAGNKADVDTYRTVTGEMYIETMIAPGRHLPLKDEISFAGNSTLELIYW